MTVFEPTPSFRLRTEARTSNLAGAGRGIFALDRARAGDFLGMDFPNPIRITGEVEVLDLPIELRMYSWRQIEHLCFAANPESRAPVDLMNHSFEPNIHWHLGHYFALADIEVGDELHLDYRHLMSPLWNDRLRDAASGRPVNGWEWREAVVESCRKVLDLLERTRPESNAK